MLGLGSIDSNRKDLDTKWGLDMWLIIAEEYIRKRVSKDYYYCDAGRVAAVTMCEDQEDAFEICSCG